jgi:hypothetical protein
MGTSHINIVTVPDRLPGENIRLYRHSHIGLNVPLRVLVYRQLAMLGKIHARPAFIYGKAEGYIWGCFSKRELSGWGRKKLLAPVFLYAV